MFGIMMMTTIVVGGVVQGKNLVFSNEQAETLSSGEFVIDVQDYEDEIELKFGNNIDASIIFDRTKDKFVINRDLTIEGTVGDATLRSFMNWDDIQNENETKKLLNHWQKLGQFRVNHLSVGAGKHELISEENGLVFSRIRNSDKIIAGINLPKGNKEINVSNIFEDGEKITVKGVIKKIGYFAKSKR